MYRYTTFNDIWLPDRLPEDDLNTGQAKSTIIDAAGGAFDYLATSRYRPRRQTIAYRGAYVGASDYLVDENGDYIVDESGNRILNTYDAAADLRNKLDAIKAQIGQRGPLIRQAESDSSRQFKVARLLSVQHQRTVRDVDRVATLDLQFEADGRPWRSVNGSTVTATLAANATTIATISPGGTEAILDAVLSITASGGSVTALTIELAPAVELIFGTIADGSELVIDCGAMTVRRNGVDAYDVFALGSGHSAAGWLPLEPGSNAVAFTLAGGPADLVLTYRDQWR
jgi:hypothetical protein